MQLINFSNPVEEDKDDTDEQRYLHTVEQMKKAAPDFVEDSLIDGFNS